MCRFAGVDGKHQIGRQLRTVLRAGNDSILQPRISILPNHHTFSHLEEAYIVEVENQAEALAQAGIAHNWPSAEERKLSM